MDTEEQIKDEFLQMQVRMESLMREGDTLGEPHRIPVTEFTLNPVILETLQQTLREREEEAVRGVERGRLNQLLTSHHLKNNAWDQMSVKPRAVVCFMSDVKVYNYPMVVDLGTEEEEEEEEEKEDLDTAEQTGTCDGKISEESEDDASKQLKTEDSHRMHEQLQLLDPDHIKTQLQMSEHLCARLQRLFNAKFDVVHDRKAQVMESIASLTGRRKFLQKELATKQTDGNAKENVSSSTRSSSLVGEDEDGDEDGDEDIFVNWIPKWCPEEDPESLLYVQENELSTNGIKGIKSDDVTETGDHVTSDEGDLQEDGAPEVKDEEETSSSRCSSWAEERRRIVANMFPDEDDPAAVLKREVPKPSFVHKPRNTWSWSEAREWRLWQARVQDLALRREAYAKGLARELSRITPTIKQMVADLDEQVMSLLEDRVRTDQALLTYRLVLSRLYARTHRIQDLVLEQQNLYEELENVEEKERHVDQEEDQSRLEVERCRSKEDRIQEQLKTEEATLKRLIINLPIEQYNLLLSMYKKNGHRSRHLEVPGGRATPDSTAGESTGPLSPKAQYQGIPMTHSSSHSPSVPSHSPSPVPSETGGARKSPLRPTGSLTSGTPSESARNYSDDPRSQEEMPEGLAGGMRTWRQFLKCRRRRHDLQDDLEEMTSRKIAGTKQLEALAKHKGQVLSLRREVEGKLHAVSEKLRLEKEDTEVVLLLRLGQVKMDLQHVGKEPQGLHFEDLRLVPKSKLVELEQEVQRIEKGDEEAEVEGGELEELLRLKAEMELKVQHAKEELQQTKTFKVSREIWETTWGDPHGAAAGVPKDSTQLYAMLQRLQQLQGTRTDLVVQESEKEELRVQQAKKRLAGLQGQVETTLAAIEQTRHKIKQMDLKGQRAKSKSRLRKLMQCRKLDQTAQQKLHHILHLESELETLRLRTFPTLSKPKV